MGGCVMGKREQEVNELLERIDALERRIRHLKIVISSVIESTNDEYTEIFLRSALSSCKPESM